MLRASKPSERAMFNRLFSFVTAAVVFGLAWNSFGQDTRLGRFDPFATPWAKTVICAFPPFDEASRTQNFLTLTLRFPGPQDLGRLPKR